jgi:hypothetical protein
MSAPTQRGAHQSLSADERRLLLRHLPGLPRPLVVVAEQVQQAVSEVAVELLAHAPPFGPGAPGGGIQGDYHVAQEGPRTRRFRYREGEDVRGPVLPPPAPVQRPDATVRHQDDGELGVPPAHRGQELARPAPEPAESRAPTGVLGGDEDAHRERQALVTSCTAGASEGAAGARGYSGRVW